ncbi:MAG: hypothetical protein OYH76_06725 [Defluviicoccus sp.]|nr:hypothetical protein [Defluviicoccus sp.]
MIAPLIDALAPTERLPVEVSDVADAIIRIGNQDRVEFYGVDRDPAVFLGTFARYRRRPKVYGEPEFVSQVIYNRNLSIAWQRVVACKELVHIFDPEGEWTNTPDQVSGLMRNLLDSPEDGGDAALLGMAAADQLALFPAAGLLFPEAARTHALEAMAAGSATIDDVVRWARMPAGIVQTVLSENWPAVLRSIIEGR